MGCLPSEASGCSETMCAKRFTFDGDKDKNDARTMSDRLGDLDGFRTSVESLPDREVMLRTRGGEPELTTRFKAKQGGVALIEPEYLDRTFFRKLSGSHDYTLASALLFLSTVVLRYGKRLRLAKPPIKEAGLVDTEDYYAGERIFSTDGIFSIITCAPKRGRINGELAKFKRQAVKVRDATVAEIEASAAGELRREMFSPRIMETLIARVANDVLASWGIVRLGAMLKFIVTPVRKVRSSIAGIPKWITFDEPVPMTAGAHDYGTMALKTNPFDHVRCFGQVYHGLLDTTTGVLTLEDNSTHFGSAHHPHDHGATYVEFATGYVPSDQSLLPTGLSFKKYAFLSGVYYQYHPLNKLMNFGTPWLYAAPDGAVYALRPASSSLGVEARLVDLMYVSESEDAVGGNIWKDPYYWTNVCSAALVGVISCKKDGSSAVASSVTAAYGGTVGLAERFGFPGCDSGLNTVLHGSWTEFTVTGGSFTSMPTVTAVVHAEPMEDNLPTDPEATSGSGRAFVGAMMTKDGAVVKAYTTYGYDRSFEHGIISHERIEVGFEVGTLTGPIDGATYNAAISEITAGEGNWRVESETHSFDVDLGRAEVMYSAAYFTAGVSMHNNGLFKTTATNGFSDPAMHQITYIGTLAQTLSTGPQAISTDTVNDRGYTQHPVSGVILVDKIPF